VRANEARAVCVANTLRCKIPHKKAFFAVLTDERNRGFFSATEQEIIRQHIPWTRLVADAQTERDEKPVELLEHVRRNRTEFVMKPNDEYGGAGVTLGWEASEKQWDEAVGERWQTGMGRGWCRRGSRCGERCSRTLRRVPRQRCGTCWWTLRRISSVDGWQGS